MVHPMPGGHSAVCLDCIVGVLWSNGWMDPDATWYGGRPRPRRHCVRWRWQETGSCASIFYSLWAPLSLAPHHYFLYAGRRNLFVTPNQQCQSTEGSFSQQRAHFNCCDDTCMVCMLCARYNVQTRGLILIYTSVNI